MVINMKKICTKLSAVLLLAVVTCTFIASCDNGEQPTGIHTSNVVSSGIDNLLEYGSYIYFGGSKAQRYNRNTGEISNACTDPECDGTCPLDESIVNVCQVADGKLFFYSFKAFEHNVRYGYQDIVTGEVVVLADLSETEAGAGQYCYYYDGYVYYVHCLLREGGNAENPDDYEDFVCRIPISGGDEERIVKIVGETMQLVAGGYIITFNDNSLYSYEINGQNRKMLISPEQNGYEYFAGDLKCLDGKLYFTCTHGGTRAKTLYSTDLKSGSTGRVLEYGLKKFILTDNAIYFIEFAQRDFYIPDDINTNPDAAAVLTDSGPTIYKCNIDGKNVQEVFTDETLVIPARCTVIDNVVYGEMQRYNDTTKAFDELEFCSLDIESGEISAARKLN